MQITKTFLIAILSCCLLQAVHAQSDSAIATGKALHFADSLIKASFYQDWKTYENLSCPSAIKFYGGKDSFHEHVVNLYYRDEPVLEEKPEALQMIIIANDIDQWQCVIEKIRSTHIENRKAKIYSYLVGQSLDNGATWKFIDVNHNSIPNIIYILPGIFDAMAIPEKRIEFEDEVIARQEAAAKKSNAKQKPTYKRRK